MAECHFLLCPRVILCWRIARMAVAANTVRAAARELLRTDWCARLSCETATEH
jgi:hypothetical protein